MKLTAACIVTAVLLAGAAMAQAQPAPTSSRTGSETTASAFGLDTPIERLVADPAAKAVLDRELPGLTTHASYPQFKGLSLKGLQPYSRGLITEERLTAVQAGLQALAAPGS